MAEQNFRWNDGFPDSSPVECVIADTWIVIVKKQATRRGYEYYIG
jgi:hypothetical protein